MPNTIAQLLTVALISAAVPAGSFELSLPVECDLGIDCHIQQFVDRDPGPGSIDFMCGTLSYDGHKGTDFRLATHAEMHAGVDVTAAVAGLVRGVREGLPDVETGTAGAPDVSGRECGNGVVLEHPEGWETQYCHLKQGSVRVKTGDIVEQGQVLGQVGMSGFAEFPHLHLSVRRNGAVIDPFASNAADGCGVSDAQSLWADPISYQDAGVLDVGFADGIPEFADVKAGKARLATFNADTQALVVWAFYFGPQAGDRLHVSILGPNGFALDETHVVSRTQAQAMRAIGRRQPSGGWPEGEYRATVGYERNGALRWTRETAISVVP